jgi:hypothetical protein
VIRVLLDRQSLPGLQQELGAFTQQVMREFQTAARALTPVRSGAARAAWQSQGRGLKTTIINARPYIRQLDQGSSRQAPRGIVQPAINQIARRY